MKRENNWRFRQSAGGRPENSRHQPGERPVPTSGEAESTQTSSREASDAHPARPGRGWFPALLLLSGTILAYLPIWHAGFIWDDDKFLTQNPLIKAADGLHKFWLTTSAPDYFPITSTTLWLEWRLWGEKPLGYHLVNVLLHAASSILLWRVAKKLKIPGAWFVAAVFAVHPVNVESVAWITERKNTLAMLFFQMTLLAYLRFDDTNRRRWYWTSILCFLFALLSKTAVAPLPAVLLGIAWWRRGRVDWKDLWRSAGFFVLAGSLALVTIWFQYHRAIGGDIVRSDNLASRVAGAGWAIGFYLYKTLLPLKLIFVYPQWHIPATSVLSYLPDLLILIFVIWCWRKYTSGAPGPSREATSNVSQSSMVPFFAQSLLFGFGYFVVMLLPVLGILNIYFMRYSLVADHWQYFAMIGPVALATAAGAWLIDRLPASSRAKHAQILKPAVGAAMLLCLGALTWKQCSTYANAETLWLTTIAKNPDCWMAYDNLGIAALENGKQDVAVAYFEKALAILPNAEACNNLGNAFLRKGDVNEAIRYFKQALELKPNFAGAHCNFGKALEMQGKIDDALAHYRDAVKNQPKFAPAHAILAGLLSRIGRTDEAIVQFRMALELDPTDVDAHYSLGEILPKTGRIDEAIAHFHAALEGRPDFSKAQNQLGLLLYQKGRTTEALGNFESVLRIHPDDSQALKNIAWVLATSPDASVRDGKRAVALAQKAEESSPAPDPLLRSTLAAALAEAGRFPEAVTAAQQALGWAQSNAPLSTLIQSQLDLFRQGRPFRVESRAQTIR